MIYNPIQPRNTPNQLLRTFEHTEVGYQASKHVWEGIIMAILAPFSPCAAVPKAIFPVPGRRVRNEKKIICNPFQPNGTSHQLLRTFEYTKVG